MMAVLPLASDGAGAETIATATNLTVVACDAPLAEDITAQCVFNGKTNHRKLNYMRDNSYQTFWESEADHGLHLLRIAPPEGSALGGLMIRWKGEPVAMQIQLRDGEDQWRTVARSGGTFQTEYIPLFGAQEEVRLLGGEDGTTQLNICEITVLTPGRLPEWVQLWQKAPDKADMMLLSGHPDDELLWFGGLLPTYAGERNKRVVVVCAAHCANIRRLELLDGLWTCGVRIYPVFMGLRDHLTNDKQQVFGIWGREETRAKVAELYRRYRPDVVVTHDVRGEYGHGVHRALSDAARAAVALAADPSYAPECAAELGVWEVPKVYVHLWEENQLHMDWTVPLSAFGGQDSLSVAAQALECHKSQTQRGWCMKRAEPWDNTLFGLYHTTVGLDEMKNDLFEHIE